jgi:nitrite reductase/ring-hydroxylating ferredoxin subunit
MATVIGRSGEIPAGGMKAADVDGAPVLVANVDGTLYGVSDICTHVGCNLSDGSLSGTTIVCPCHGSEFNVTNGEVLGGPARGPLKTFNVQVVGDEVQVSG